jgi:hypothetical protein
MNRYEEQAELLAVITSRVDKYGRTGGLRKYRGRHVRVLILVHDPTFVRRATGRRGGDAVVAAQRALLRTLHEVEAGLRAWKWRQPSWVPCIDGNMRKEI